MRYLLVHGSWHGPNCWDQLSPYLEKQGHNVDTFEFPGYGTDGPSEVTYRDYYDHLEQAISQYKEPIVLVAHSMAGIVAGPLSDRLAEKMCHCFFVSAFIPQHGESLLDVARRYEGSQIATVMQFDHSNKRHSLDTERAKEILYHDCTKKIKDLAAQKLRPQPFVPHQTPVEWKDDQPAKDKRTYIVCDQDRVLPPVAQLEMATQHGCRVIHMDSGHCPLLSQPKQLAKILMDIPSE